MTALRWHWANDGLMICNDCEAEVYGFKEGLICSGCKRVEDDRGGSRSGGVDVVSLRNDKAPPFLRSGVTHT